ncbi:MAG: ComEC family competence protein [Armatimonadetes bacterium]|nr:ComEC family competence protein [Armatimonadota bacterium]
MSRPAAYVAIAFGFGILAAEYVSLWIVLATSGVLAVASASSRRKSYRSVLAIVAGAFLIGAWRYQLGRTIAHDDISRFVRSVDAMIGTIASDLEIGNDQMRFVLLVDAVRSPQGWRRASGRVMVSAYPSEWSTKPESVVHRLEYGNRMLIEARPYLPTGPTNPGRLSWKDYLGRRGIYSCATLRDVSKIGFFDSSRFHFCEQRSIGCDVGRVVPTAKESNPVVRMALRAKSRLVASIERLAAGEGGAVIAGMVIGSYAYLPPDVCRNFSRTGTLHLLAASGFNCWVLIFLVSPLLGLVRVYPRWRGALVIVFMLGYVLMVGGKPSLVRAAIMASLMLIARPLGRVSDTISLFFVAAIIILSINPASLFDVGFQLSFLAVWAIIYVSPIIGANSLLSWAGIVNRDPSAPRSAKHFALRKLTGSLGSTAIATIAVSLVTAPVIAYYFNYVSLVSVPANVAVGLGVPVVFGAGLASPVASQAGPLGEVVGFIGSQTTNAMLTVVNVLGEMKWSAISVASPSVLAIVGYYVILHAVLNWLRSRDGAR